MAVANTVAYYDKVIIMAVKSTGPRLVGITDDDQGILAEGRRLSTVDLLIKVACFEANVSKILNIKSYYKEANCIAVLGEIEKTTISKIENQFFSLVSRNLVWFWS